MRLTTKGRYAVVAMAELAAHRDGRPVSLGEIAEARAISLAYLEQLFCKLRRAGLVASVRGPGGGYRLGKAADAIAISAILKAVDEDLGLVAESVDDLAGLGCPFQRLWLRLADHVQGFLDSVSLAELVDDCAQAQLQAQRDSAA